MRALITTITGEIAVYEIGESGAILLSAVQEELRDVALTPDGTIYLADARDIYRYGPTNGSLEAIQVPDKPNTTTITGLTSDDEGNLFVGYSNFGVGPPTIEHISASTGTIIRSFDLEDIRPNLREGVEDLVVQGNLLYVLTEDDVLLTIDVTPPFGFNLLNTLELDLNQGVALLGNDGEFFVVDEFGSVSQIELTTGQTTFAGFAAVPGIETGGEAIPDDFLLSQLGIGETRTGTADPDLLLGTPGNDIFDGAGGTDTVRFGSQDNVFTLRLGSAIEIEDRSGGEGVDSLTSIEVIEFSNRTFELFRFDDVARLSPDQFSTFTEMYIAYFNRAPDAAGLMFWANAFATGTSLEEIAVFFAASDEAQALYPEDSPSSEFVEAIYLNVLGRPSDPDGAAFWTNVLTEGEVSRAEFVLQVLRGARADAPSDATAEFVAQLAADVNYLDDKVSIGTYFSAVLGMSDLNDAQNVMMLFDGSDESIQAARSAADADFSDAVANDGGGDFLIQLVGVVDNPFAG